MKTLELPPTYPPRLNHSSSLILDTHSNPWILKKSKYLKSSQIPKSSKTQEAPRQVQHRLCRSLQKFRQNFRTKAAQHLFANHLLNLPHDFHIFNKQGKMILLTPYYREMIVILGGKILEMNVGYLPMGLTNDYRQPTQYNLSERSRYQQFAQ